MPTLRSLTPGDQPPILLWNDDGDENDYVGREFTDSETRSHKDFDIWSFGPDKKNDPKNNGKDDTEPPNHLVDEEKLELKDDVCSWNK